MAKPGTLKTVTSTTKKASTYVPKLTLNSSTPTKDYTSSMLKNLDRIKSQTSSYSSRAASVGSDLDDFTKQLLNRTRM